MSQPEAPINIKICYRDNKKKLRRAIRSIEELHEIGSLISGKNGHLLLYTYIDAERDEIDLTDQQDLDNMLADVPQSETVKIYVREKGEKKKWSDKFLRDAWVFDPKTRQKVKYSSKTPQPQIERRMVAKETARDLRIKEKRLKVEKKFEEKKKQLEQEYEAQIRKIEEIERKAKEDAERVEQGKQIKRKDEGKLVNFATISTADVNEGNVGFRGGKLVRIREFEARVQEVREKLTGPIDEGRLEKIVARFGEESIEVVVRNYQIHKEKWSPNRS